MNDDTDLDPAIRAALRAVPPADAATREAHIAAALDQLDAVRPRTGAIGQGQRWLSIAAAVVALAGGFALGRAGQDAPAPQRNTAISDTTVPPKASTSCSVEVADDRVLANYDSDTGPRMIVLRKDAIVILDATSCATLQTIPLP